MRTFIVAFLVLLLSATTAHAHYYDGETGLDQNYQRDYNPGSGRYIEADPIGIRSGTNHLYIYVGNNPIIFVDPTGLAYFAKRRLRPFPWLGPYSNNPGGWDDVNNTEISHEHLFFEDGKYPTNLGYFDDNSVRPDNHLQIYYLTSGHYNDCIMRKAVNNVIPLSYQLLGSNKYNCQDWAEDVRREYMRLLSDKNVLKECGECVK